MVMLSVRYAENESMYTLIAQRSVEKQYDLRPELNRYGDKGVKKSLEDAKYNLQFLAAAAEADSSRLFIDYVIWERKLFNNINLPSDILTEFYECTVNVLKELYHEKEIEQGIFDKLTEYIEGSLQVLYSFNNKSGYENYEVNPYQKELDRYSEYVLAGNRNEAAKFILGILQDGMDVKNIYKYIMHPFQVKLGDLWHSNKISVGHEHYATAISQFIMSLFYEKIFMTPKNGYVFLGACVQGELHEFGIRMVCDYMESCGFETVYLGANMPDASVLSMIKEKRPDVIGLSCTMTYNIPHVKDLIKTIHEFNSEIPILVGGYVFNCDENLWRNVGADVFCRSFDDACLTAEKFSERRRLCRCSKRDGSL